MTHDSVIFHVTSVAQARCSVSVQCSKLQCRAEQCLCCRCAACYSSPYQEGIAYCWNMAKLVAGAVI